MRRNETTVHFVGFAFPEPLSITQPQNTNALFASIEQNYFWLPLVHHPCPQRANFSGIPEFLGFLSLVLYLPCDEPFL